jgi:hypothetical protein
MFKLTEILLNMTNLIFKYSSLILSLGFILLGIWVFFFPAELSRNAGIAMFIVGILFSLFIFIKKGK